MGVKLNVQRSRPDNQVFWITEGQISEGPLYEEESYLLPTSAQKITCQHFHWMLLSSGQNLKRCEQTLLFIVMHYWGHMSLEIRGQWGLLLPPYLLITVVQQPGTSSPPSQLKHSSEGVIWMCRASFTNSSCPLLRSSTVVSSQWVGWWFSHVCSSTANLSVIPLSPLPHHLPLCHSPLPSLPLLQASLTSYDLYPQ